MSTGTMALETENKAELRSSFGYFENTKNDYVLWRFCSVLVYLLSAHLERSFTLSVPYE